MSSPNTWTLGFGRALIRIYRFSSRPSDNTRLGNSSSSAAAASDDFTLDSQQGGEVYYNADFDPRNRETASANPGSLTWRPPRRLTRADECRGEGTLFAARRYVQWLKEKVSAATTEYSVHNFD